MMNFDSQKTIKEFIQCRSNTKSKKEKRIQLSVLEGGRYVVNYEFMSPNESKLKWVKLGWQDDQILAHPTILRLQTLVLNQSYGATYAIDFLLWDSLMHAHERSW
jgi:hypothetical protein